MVLDKLGRTLHGALQKLTRAPHVDERVIKELVRDIQRALLQADVNVEFVLELTKRIEKRGFTEKLPPGMARKEHIIKIVYEELSTLMGRPTQLQLKPGQTTVLLMVGLQGSGKTTSVAKLAAHFKKLGFKVGIVCADTFRPGAYEQLSQLGQQVGTRFFGNPKAKDSIKLAKEGVKQLKKERLELIVVDTAGRHRKEEALMEEMHQIAKAIGPDEIMLVVDGTIGQQGTAKGGGALSAVAATDAPIKFIGAGEHLDDLEPFVPERFVARMLGMGDIETLLKRIEETARAEEVKPADMKAILAGKLTLQDVYSQLEMMGKMGPLKKLMQMIPGLGVAIPEEQMRVGEEKLKRFKVIMQSMTPEELENPKVLNTSRIRRIARGSGTGETDVKELLKQYEFIKKLIKKVIKGRGPKFGPFAKLIKQLPKEISHNFETRGADGKSS